ncbi:MAG: hypothetical protein M5U15_11615 [Kiritimatiellae bacterium]|nr:hypothetical protein [Kiritimatiellia bacterium]
MSAPIYGGDTTRRNPNREGMKQKIDQKLLDELEALCDACPNGRYTNACPFRLLNTLSRGARRSLLKGMHLDQVNGLFDLAEGCACPKDPRQSNIMQRQEKQLGEMKQRT